MNRIMRWIAWALLCVALPVSGQRDTSVFKGKPWERIEQQRDDIESTILSGDVGSGYVLSASHLFEWKNTPAFYDIATSVYRAYGGLPLSEQENLLSFLKGELSINPQGIGWLEYGLLAMAAMKPEKAIPAFKQAAMDSLCYQAPLTHALLGVARTQTGGIRGATESFQTAIKAASKEQVVQFQMRNLYAETMLEKGRIAEWQKAVEECCNSNSPLECAWGLEQEAQNAWHRKDMTAFESFINLALAQAATYGASPSWQWRFEKDRWEWTTERLKNAKAALDGENDGKLIFDIESEAIDEFQGNLEDALKRLEPWLPLYPLKEIDTWDSTRQLWGQRLHMIYYNTLTRLGRHEDAIAGLEAMLPYARDNYHVKFEPHIHCYIAYALMLSGRLDEARAEYETGLSVLDAPGKTLDPSIAYYPEGRIGKKARVMFAANYRHLMGQINKRETN